MCFNFLALAQAQPHPAIILPFAILLAAIAVMPFAHLTWWERHYPKVALGLGAITVTYYTLILHAPRRMLLAAHDYVSFIALIGSLFVVAGGIHISVRGEARPLRNCLFLLIGALLSNVIGTTGASMLLIRPWIRMNKYRITGFHVVFFIFIISNAGGCLTPIGDPPLFLGYLRGVPFWWVLKQCWIAWVLVVGGLLAIFFLLDRHNFLRAPAQVREKETRQEIWTIQGWRNLGFLALILIAVFLKTPAGAGEALMVVAAIGSWFGTPQQVHQANAFGFGPLKEVVWLFAGIFATMTPVLDYLQTHSETLGLNSVMQCFWFTGILSGALDNAPTYLTFLAAAMGQHKLSLNEPADVLSFVAQRKHELIAISLGAVFFGAMTYIGNGPNFMVRAIAEREKVETPGFFGYIFRYAIPILLPLLVLVSLLLLALKSVSP